ncbi:MAG: TauD/TfdA family dioxygenase [Betaproteobacteria bacterium]
MPAPHLQPVTDRSAWRGEDLARAPQDWIYRLSATEIAELESAASAVKGREITGLSRDDFHLPVLDTSLTRIAHEVDFGRGFCLLRGFPAERHTDEECALVVWAVASRLGRAITQNAAGDLVGHVRDLGRKLGDKNVRGYDGTSELRFHVDECDHSVLMCLRTAKSGGLSAVVSSAQVFNQLLATRPDALAKLFAGYVFSLMGEERPGVGPVSDHLIPIFSWHENRMSCRYTINTVLQAAQYGAPISETDREILFSVQEAAKTPGLALSFAQEPGDIQLLNCLSTLHHRTSYEDYAEPERKRHLLRIWLAAHRPRPLAPEFEERFNGGWSFRRGIPVRA